MAYSGSMFGSGQQKQLQRLLSLQKTKHKPITKLIKPRVQKKININQKSDKGKKKRKLVIII